MFNDSPQMIPYRYFSACDAAGYNGQWVGGICPYWGTDICTCKEFKEILKSIGLTPNKWFSLEAYKREDFFPEEWC